MKRIVVHIDRLVLRGVDPATAGAVSGALQTELQALLAEPGAAANWVERGHVSALRTKPVTVPSATDGGALGRAVAGGAATGALR